MRATREQIYVDGLLRILAEGPNRSAEVIEDRPLPDLATLAGDDAELRRRVTAGLDDDVHPEFGPVFDHLTRLPGLAWNLRGDRGRCQIFNPTPGLPTWNRVTIEKLSPGDRKRRGLRRGIRRGIRVTVQPLSADEAAARVVEGHPFPTRIAGGILSGLLLVVLNMQLSKIPEWAPWVLIALLWGAIFGLERLQDWQRQRQEEEVRQRVLALRETLYAGPEPAAAADSAGGAPQRITGVLLETGQEATTKFVAAYADGSVRCLYTDGEGVTVEPPPQDDPQWPLLAPVLAAAQAVIAAAAPFLGDFTPEAGRPLPPPGRVRMVLLTTAGIRAAEENEHALESRTSPFWPIHQASRTLEAAISRARDDQNRLAVEQQDRS